MFFAGNHLTYNGVDISPSTVNFCKSIGLNCELTTDTVSWLNNNPKKFDIITCLDVLEHVPRENIIAFLAAIKTALSASGKVIIQVPNLQSPFGYLHHFNCFTHVSGFVEHSLAQVLLASGFSRFEFNGFEETVKINFKSRIKLLLRSIFRKFIHLLRMINGNPNPKLLDPVMYAIVYK